ncbi:kelch-like protein 17 [Gigaspora margarita]|uniref:Kelch-like protein 17 n=1 Tax=Gigaspora margarita TaxID=4874 RepID=A0A8H3WYD6_GIGMA|nr:kelch-like protein 17 [Gigaspora margarita]
MKYNDTKQIINFQSLLKSFEFYDILIQGAQVLCLKELCDYIENIVVEQTDLIKKHISLINRKGLSGFTKLAELVRTVTNISITNSTYAINLPKRQLSIQLNLIEQEHIVLTVKWINDISNLNPPSFYTFNLLQRASRHGSSSKKFHDQCDSKGATLLIIRVKGTGKILGGYNPIDWYKETSKNVYHSTSTSFIFSLNL